MIKSVMLRDALLVASLALVGAAWIVKAWELHPTVPLAYSGDALLHLSYVENLRDGGWYFYNERLAAPFGQDVRDFPLGAENAHWLALKVLGYFLPNAAATGNGYFILSYPLVAVVAFLVARRLGLGRGPAAVVGLLYTFLPFHQLRWTNHLLRSAYYMVPLGTLAIFRLIEWRSLRMTISGRTRWVPRRVVPLMLIAVLLGASDTQHALYGAAILLVVASVVALRDREIRPVVYALVFGVIAGASLVANNFGALDARVERGENGESVDRDAFESEFYGLRPAHLVRPPTNHRVPLLADAGEAVVDATSPESGELAPQYVGAVGVVGLVIGFAGLATAGTARPILKRAPVSLARCGLVAAVAIGLASVGSVPTLIAAAGGTMFRTWNRMSIWIAFVALLAVGAALQTVIGRIHRRWLAAFVLVLVVVAGLLDQVVPNPQFDPAALADQWEGDDAFFGDVEAALPTGAMVHQMPMAQFPEAGPIFDMDDYRHTAGYLHTDSLRWSYGGMRGRPEGKWLESLAELDVVDQLMVVAGLGFDAVLVDRRGYADNGSQVEKTLQNVGADLLVMDEREERTVWGLGEVQQRAAAVEERLSVVLDQLAHPVVLLPGDRFFGDEGPWPAHNMWTRDSIAEATLETGDARQVVIVATLSHADPDATRVTVELGNERVAVPIRGAPGRLILEADLPTGESTVRLWSDGKPSQVGRADPRVLAIRVEDLAILDKELLEAVCPTTISTRLPCEVISS